ncbi:MAG: hypothetical protein JNN01_11820 [Opitutaceae bacterium]|nr:hypothetical protein [Opitutaceae bacterium]
MLAFSSACLSFGSTNVFLNLSSRARIAPGQDTLIAGLVVETSSNVLIRGIGPGLQPFGISQPLANPTLTLFDNQGKVVAHNADWRSAIPGSDPGSTAAVVSDIMARVGAFAPATGDSALYVRFAPGLYTAQLAGAGEVTGVGLVEAYVVPGTLDPLDPVWRLPTTSTGAGAPAGFSPGTLVGPTAGSVTRLRFAASLPWSSTGAAPEVNVPWRANGQIGNTAGRSGVVDSRGWTISPSYEKTGATTAVIRNLVVRPGFSEAYLEVISLTFTSFSSGQFSYAWHRLNEGNTAGIVLGTGSGTFDLIPEGDATTPEFATAAPFFPRHAEHFSDGRPPAFWGLQVEDLGEVLKRGLGPDSSDREGTREPVVTRIGEQYLLHYDGAGARGWLACAAVSTDLVNWTRQGPILDFGPPGSRDAGGACSPWIIEHQGTWHMFYLGSRTATPPPERVPESPYPSLKARASSPWGPWVKQPEVQVIALNSTFPSPDSSPGAVVREANGWRQYFSMGRSVPGLAAPQRTLILGRTTDLNATWTFEPAPLLPWEEQVENSSVYFDETSRYWFLFTNHIGIDATGGEYADAVWVYWSQDPARFDPRNKAVVMDGSTSRWAHGAIGMPAVIKVGDRLALLYDGVPGEGRGHLPRNIGLAWIRLPLRPPF